MKDRELGVPSLPGLIAQVIFEQLKPDFTTLIASHHVTPFTGHVKIFHSATVTFIAPSDPSGTGNMQNKYICAMPSWH
ncbi:hypothetical protein M404DRAFT_151681 [Pisolithus tinctorius Marx 270]|uniref:Uncharacterized protein n=1 Tax=Pisolithus tinctorius Marx 270 TaxID=870435 RepID=A0A0C3IVR2_PISTI|nr:hypothetical protein M404DRAFT_151681 [Pisolithus tinctorius Marx 270]